MPQPLPALIWLICFLTSLPAVSVSAGALGSVSERTYQRLAKVHELMEAQRHDAALALLEGIASSEARPYEQALILQTYGYLYAAQAQYRQAVTAFTRCLALDALPRSAAQDIRYALAQLQLALGEDEQAVASIEQWLAAEPVPSPEAHALSGAVFAQGARYQEAIKHLQKAIASVDNPGEIWFQQLLAVYFETERYPSAEKLLPELVIDFPHRKRYWIQLSGIYQLLQQDAKALAVLELAYRKGFSFTESELLKLIRYYLFMGLPYRAAVVLEDALQDRLISPSATNFELLSNAWLQAKEISRALAALEDALARASAPELRLRQAELAAAMDDWPRVLLATRTLQKGGGSQPLGQAFLLQGMAHFYLGQHRAALQAFERAKSFDDLRERAEAWVNHVAQESVPRSPASGVGSSGPFDPSPTAGEGIADAGSQPPQLPLPNAVAEIGGAP